MIAIWMKKHFKDEEHARTVISGVCAGLSIIALLVVVTSYLLA